VHYSLRVSFSCVSCSPLAPSPSHALPPRQPVNSSTGYRINIIYRYHINTKAALRIRPRPRHQHCIAAHFTPAVSSSRTAILTAGRIDSRGLGVPLRKCAGRAARTGRWLDSGGVSCLTFISRPAPPRRIHRNPFCPAPLRVVSRRICVLARQIGPATCCNCPPPPPLAGVGVRKKLRGRRYCISSASSSSLLCARASSSSRLPGGSHNNNVAFACARARPEV
jgi:hypothetical protein